MGKTTHSRCGSSAVVRSLGRLLVCLVCTATPAMAVDVAIPDTSVGYGSSVVLPLRLTDVSPDNIVSLEFDIAFDPQVMTLDSISVVGTTVATWLADTLRVTGASGDTIRFVGATASDAITTDEVVLFLYGSLVDLRVPTTSVLSLSHVLVNDGSGSTTIDHGSVTLVGDDGDISASPDPVNLDGTITIQVTDADADVSGSADQVEVRVSANGDSETLQASETGATTAVFSTSIDVVLGVTPIVGDGLVQAYASVDIDVCFTDSLAASGATVERCATILVFGGDDGDLTATVVLQPGDTLYVRLEDTDLIASDSSDVVIVNGRTLESEALRLPQTAALEGVFFSRLTTAFGASAGSDDDGVLLAQQGDSLWVRYSDAFTAFGDTGSTQVFSIAIDPLGDASGNGNVRGFDAALILDHSVGAVTLAGLDSLAANLDQQAPFGPITAFDASLVLQYRVGLLSRFPIQQKDADNHPQPEAGASNKIAVEYLPVALEATDTGWRLLVDGETNLLSGHLLLGAYEGEITAGTGLQNALLRRFDQGLETRLAFARSQPQRGSQEILLFSGDRAPDVRTVIFNGGAVVGQVRASGGSPTVAPTRFILHPAMPNPFNPTTNIRYELAEAVHMQLLIVNALGQQVRTLVDAPRSAGRHNSVWDGRSDTGQSLAAGMYFYVLRAGQYSATGKMVLAK